jgi:hypothetical protein
MDTRDVDGTSAFVAGLGGIVIVLVAGVALVLTICVVGCAATGGRFTGVLTGLVGAVSFDFFHTPPYNTLRMDRAKDVETVILLLVIGAVAGELTHLRDRYREEKAQSDDLLETVLALSHVVASGAPVDQVWDNLKVALAREFGSIECRFEPFGAEAPPLPRIEPSGALPRSLLRRFMGRGFLLPDGGAELAVSHGREPLGRIVIIPLEPRGVSLRERRVGVALTEQFALVLAQTSDRTVLR